MALPPRTLATLIGSRSDHNFRITLLPGDGEKVAKDLSRVLSLPQQPCGTRVDSDSFLILLGIAAATTSSGGAAGADSGRPPASLGPFFPRSRKNGVWVYRLH